MKRLASEFETHAIYEKNYLRKGLMQYVGHTDGKPMLLYGHIHRKDQGTSKRGYCTNVKIYFSQHKNSEIYMLTNHLMVTGIHDAIRFYFMNNPPTQQRASNTATIYMLGYPEPYKTEDDERCGFRLAYDCMELPFHIGKDETFLRKACTFAYIPPAESYYKKSKASGSRCEGKPPHVQ